MTKSSNERFLRECANDIIKISDQGAVDSTHLVQALLPPLKRLSQGDFMSLGVKRQANHITNSKYLYYDGLLVITLDEFPKGKLVPPHDHGVWEALVAYKGSFRHTVYKRTDDGTREGYADLETVDDRILLPGDIGIVAEPAEIHSFVALEENTYSVTVVGGHYKEIRHYFNLENKTCVVQRPKVVA